MTDSFTDNDGTTYVRISGDFESIFNQKNMQGLINSNDEIAVILRGHLILEEFLNLWVLKNLGYDIFGDKFFAFKTKLDISMRVGLRKEFINVLSEINTLRNKLSHRIGFEIKISDLNSIRDKVNRIKTSKEVDDCDTLTLTRVYHQDNGIESFSMDWNSSDFTNKLIAIIYTLIMKLIIEFQDEFIARDIDYKIC